MPSNDLAASNPRAVQARIGYANATKAAGQRAHDLRLGPQPEYVDASRSHLNRVLKKPITGAELKSICVERRARRETKRAMKSNASVGIVGVITFGHEAQKTFERLTPDQQDAAYREVAEAIAARLGTTLTGLAVHVDESAPHAHFQCPSYDHEGRAISETTKKGALSDLQTIVAEVMARHAPGIERGHSKRARLKAGAKPSEVIHKSVRQLHDELPLEIARREEELEALRLERDGALKEIGRQRKRAADALAKADRLRAKEDRAAQAIKTAGVYEARARKAEERRAVLEAQISRLEAALEERRARHGREGAALDADLEEKRARFAAQEASDRAALRKELQEERARAAADLEREAEASRGALQKELEDTKARAALKLKVEEYTFLGEMRRNARIEAWGQKEKAAAELEAELVELRRKAEIELEAQRQEVLAKARQEAEGLEASLLSDGGRQLKALRTENAGLRENIGAWRAFQDLLTAALKLLLGEERFAAFRAVFMADWEKHPTNPKRKEPDPDPTPEPSWDSGPSGP